MLGYCAQCRTEKNAKIFIIKVLSYGVASLNPGLYREKNVDLKV
jgi:hypothetical protein